MRHFGDFIDRIDLAGWTLTLSGMIVIAVTALTPAYLKTRAIEAQTVVLRQIADRTRTHHENYIAFNQALHANDPLLLERLAWHHLRMQPEGSQEMIQTVDVGIVPSVDQWVAPHTRIHVPDEIQLPDSHLVRLVTGEPRPWVLGFGAWLVLTGLLINPVVRARREATQEDNDDDLDDAPWETDPDAEDIDEAHHHE